MYRRTQISLGILRLFLDELKKVPAYFAFKTTESAKEHADAASRLVKFWNGENLNEDASTAARRKQHREAYEAILRTQQTKAAAERAEANAKKANLPWSEKIRLSLKEAKEGLKQATSTKAGVMALLQHCTASHAAEIAIEQNIDVKSVNMVFEKASASTSVGHEEVVVGYIDAPTATTEEVMVFAEKLQRACPVANSMHIEWKQGCPSAASSTSTSFEKDREWKSAPELQQSIEQAARRTFEMGAASSDSQHIPAGTPGYRRMTEYTSRSQGDLRGESDDFDLHLPVRKSQNGPMVNNAESLSSEAPATSHDAPQRRPNPPEGISASAPKNAVPENTEKN